MALALLVGCLGALSNNKVITFSRPPHVGHSDPCCSVAYRAVKINNDNVQNQLNYILICSSAAVFGHCGSSRPSDALPNAVQASVISEQVARRSENCRRLWAAFVADSTCSLIQFASAPSNLDVATSPEA